MTTSLIAALVILVFIILIILFSLFSQRLPPWNMRAIPAFDRLERAVGMAVETGNRLHLSLGSGDLIGRQSAIAFVGLSMLRRVARATSVSDKPPVATSGEGAVAILSQDTLRGAARDLGVDFDVMSGRLTGATPFSYAAGALSLIHDEDVGANLLVGSFAAEVALINEAGERAHSLTLAGTDNIPGQAVLFATANETLIGEEAFAGGAYLGAGRAHLASLRAQDIVRLGLVFVIVAGALLKLAGVL